jgi:uncharacterized LabA/DUF88 family protein
MFIYPQEKTSLFIDGANLYATAKALGFDIDYQKLLQYFYKRARLMRAFYYTALFEDHDFSPVRPLVDWLDYNGYHMVTKNVREYTDNSGNRHIKGNMDVELAIDAMECVNYLDHIILFSGDGDFTRLVRTIQRKGVRVSVVSTIKTSPQMISDDLRREADNFIDLHDLKSNIGRLGNSAYSNDDSKEESRSKFERERFDLADH